MRLYLDDDSVDRLLVRLLQNAGHDVELPRQVGFSGLSDSVHLRHAISADRALLSANDDDFRELHELILQAGGEHPGILIARYDNDRRRDLTPRGIVIAIGKLLAAGVPLENEFIILNQWR
ncbi:MAG TPA: DUF5615 family PIN-like protein [Lacipirellulaceae bacterium]